MDLVKRGVAVYSMPNLHAKVFVLGRAAYIGSANVSSRSASQLLEAVIRTTEPDVLRAAKQFVRRLCVRELTPTVLKRLAKIYRPPVVPGGRRADQHPVSKSEQAVLPRLLIAQLELENWPESYQALHDAAIVVAKQRRRHPKSFELESFRQTGSCPYRRDDVVVQVTDEGHGDVFVTPPGNVIHVRTRKDGNRQVSFVYLERPARRRRQLRKLGRALGHGAQKRLRRGGIVRHAPFAQALLNAWAV